MSGDSLTQSPNLDKIILRNVIIVEATEWGWSACSLWRKER